MPRATGLLLVCYWSEDRCKGARTHAYHAQKRTICLSYQTALAPLVVCVYYGCSNLPYKISVDGKAAVHVPIVHVRQHNQHNPIHGCHATTAQATAVLLLAPLGTTWHHGLLPVTVTASKRLSSIYKRLLLPPIHYSCHHGILLHSVTGTTAKRPCTTQATAVLLMSPWYRI